MVAQTELAPLPNSLWEDLRIASTATLSTELVRHGLRRTMMRGVFPLEPGSRLAGEAFTLRFGPAREDITSPAMLGHDRSLLIAAVETVPPGQVLVIDARGELNGSVIGDILALRMARRGAAGVVTDGAVRDVAPLRAIGLPVFAAGLHPAPFPAVHVALDMGRPVSCGGVLVLPGDVLAGDDDGVLVLPRAVAATIAREAREHEELERYVQQRIDRGESTAGLYPPNDATRAAYERERHGQAP